MEKEDESIDIVKISTVRKLDIQSASKLKRNMFLNMNSLDLPSDNVFYHVQDEDNDKGAIYYPASLFYKLYRRKEILGEGTLGVTRRYIKRTAQQSVAVKIVRAREDSEIFSQMKSEFYRIKALDHPCIIKPLELYFDDSKAKIYYLMELCPGNTLQSIISSNRKILRR